MSTLEKTINLLNALPENQIETIYSFVQFLSSQQTKEMPGGEKTLDDILGNIVGVIPDTGKNGKRERKREKYRSTKEKE